MKLFGTRLRCVRCQQRNSKLINSACKRKETIIGAWFAVFYATDHTRMAGDREIKRTVRVLYMRFIF